MRQLRTLGLLGLLAFALTAMFGAGSALASGFVTKNASNAAEYPAYVSASNTASATFNPGGISCETATGSTKLSGAMKAMTLIASQSGCKSTIGGSSFKWTWNSNNCQLIFHPGAETSPGNFSGTYDVGGTLCTTGIKITGELGGVCNFIIPPQSGLDATFANSGEGTKATVSLQQADGGVHYTVEREGSVLCPKNAGSYEDGNWSANLSAKATNEAGTPLGLSAAANAPTGFYAEGGQFKGESYPLPVAGDQAKTIEFKYGPGASESRCLRHHFSTLFTAASATLSPTSTLSECSMLLGGSRMSATVAMNSCAYAFNAAGTLGISCTKAGDAIAITNPSTGCVLSIGAQSGLSGITIANVGSGVDRGVEISINATGVSYTASKGLLSCGVTSGAHSDGSFTGSLVLYGGTA